LTFARRVILITLTIGAFAFAQPQRTAAVDTRSAISPMLYQDMHWRLIGPFRGGRTVAAAGIPAEPSVAYVAASNGGVWRTTDFGQTWKPIFDGQPTESVGALAIAPSDPNIIYLGSGEGLRRPDLSTGDGIYKSIDQGRTWTHLGLRDGQQIGTILVDPQDPNRVFVAVLGHPYGPNAERGVFRSTDGGVTWQKVLYKDEDTGAIDLAFDPTNTQTVYAVLWVSRRPPWYSMSHVEAPGSGLFVSHDGGSTWQQLTGGLPGTAQGLGRIGITIAPSDRNRMYAWVDADDQHGGIYRSDDAGLNWRRVNGEDRIWGRGSDFACVRVDPQNPDRIYVANTSTYVSDNGGASFAAIKGAPGGDDYHQIWINPVNPSIILLTSDQGATITVNGGSTWSSWYNQPTAQLYHVSTDNRFPYWVYGGQQESGSAGVASRSDFGEITFRDWHPVGVEEWGYVAPDPLDPNIIYGGKVTRYDQRTGQLQDVSPVVFRTRAYRFERTAPLAFSPVDPHALYLGSNVVFKTTDGGKSWRVISPDLTRPNPPKPPNLGVFAPATTPRGVVYSLAPGYKNSAVLWAGTDDGLIWRTTDGGRHWKDVTPADITPWSMVSIIDASRFDDQTAYAAVGRIRLDDGHPYIYKTRDAGKTWRKIVNGLPEDDPVNVVRADPQCKGLLFAGTEHAVYVSFDDGGFWLPLQLNLPATSMRDLTVHGDDLIVATHGRGFWILDDIAPLRQIATQNTAARTLLFKPQAAIRLRRDQNTDTPLPPEVPAGQNPPDGAIIDYYLASHPSGESAISILDSKGRLVRRYASTDRPPVFLSDLNVPTYWIRAPRVMQTSPGMHRFVWDLRYTPPHAFTHAYPISAVYHDTPAEPLGPMALPGTYTVRLEIEGRTYSQPLTLHADPRVVASPADLARELDAAQNLVRLLDRDYDMVQRIRSMERPAVGGPGRKPSAVEDDLVQLNDQISGLLVTVDGADSAPTTQQLAAIKDLARQLEALGKRL
jgi:photosystem II stability/assembly factor-like uncharacterized protein